MTIVANGEVKFFPVSGTFNLLYYISEIPDN